jgi:hypothetical protein
VIVYVYVIQKVTTFCQFPGHVQFEEDKHQFFHHSCPEELLSLKNYRSRQRGWRWFVFLCWKINLISPHEALSHRSCRRFIIDENSLIYYLHTQPIKKVSLMILPKKKYKNFLSQDHTQFRRLLYKSATLITSLTFIVSDVVKLCQNILGAHNKKAHNTKNLF